jgi:hypothetical protein
LLRYYANDTYDYVINIYLAYGDPIFYVVSKDDYDHFVDQVYYRNNMLIRKNSSGKEKA